MATQDELYYEINKCTIPKELESLWNSLDKFVKQTCINRDMSHDYNHMKQVAYTSMYIQKQDYPDLDQESVNIMLASAWLHDVADHKYDYDGELSKILNKCLSDLFKYPTNELIYKIIKYTSFTQENRENISDWTHIFSDPAHVIIRHIVSDADKLDTLGSRGITRIVSYAKFINKDIKEHLEYIAINRISLLKNNYIKTDTGKKLAEIFHDEFFKLLNEYSLSSSV